MDVWTSVLGKSQEPLAKRATRPLDVFLFPNGSSPLPSQSSTHPHVHTSIRYRVSVTVSGAMKASGNRVSMSCKTVWASERELKLPTRTR